MGIAMGYDCAAIMRDAHKRYRDSVRLRLGWSWGQCLATAWRRCGGDNADTAVRTAAIVKGFILEEALKIPLLAEPA